MGHKVNPKVFRIKINKTWDSRWFSEKDYAYFLMQDVRIRRYLKKKLKEAQLSKVDIERSANAIRITLVAAKPGLIIGRGGQGVEQLKKDIHNRFLKDAFSRKKGIKDISISVVEVENAAHDAAVIMHQVIADLERRIPFRRTVKQAIARSEKAGVKGIKIIVAGRLNGAEIARSETAFSGKIPLHTLRADIDYCRGAAQTIYGQIGVKVWVYRGEIFNQESAQSESSTDSRIK